MASLLRKTYTPAEYLAFERKATEKHEYFDGDIFAISGAKKEHVRISGNIYYFLRTQLAGKPCEIFNSDMRVKVSPSGLCAYPDVSVACAPLEFEDEEVDVLLNPRILFEVLAPTTERRDRTFKFGHYQQIPSLAEIIFVTQDAPFVERFIRVPGALWQFDNASGLEGQVQLEAIGCTLSMAQIYQGVEFPPEEKPLIIETKNA